MIEGLELAIGWHRQQAAELRARRGRAGGAAAGRQLETRARWHDESAEALARIAAS